MTGAATSFDALAAAIEWPDAEAAAAARSAGTAGGPGGRLAELREWFAATRGAYPAPALSRPRLLLVGVDTPLAATGTDIGVRTVGRDAHSVADGFSVADDEVDAGADLLVVATGAPGDTLPVVVSLLTGAEPVTLLPRGAAAVDTAAWIDRAQRVRDLRRRVADLRRDPAALLERLGDPVLAVTTGIVLQAVVRRTPLVLDGVAAAVAGLVVADLASRAARWWQVADTLADPVHTRAAAECDRTPLLSLGVPDAPGTTGLLAVHLIRAALDAEGSQA